MNKLAQLFNRIENFSVDAHFEYQMVKLAAGADDILAKYENFDIKDEDLFNQFETFMSGYKDLMSTLKVDSEHLDPDSFEDAGELLTTLEKRLERIVKNPYFSMTEAEGWDEEFDPADLLEFAVQVYDDAANKLKSFAGEDFEISDMKAAQLAREFNQQGIDKGDKNITWTGDKVRQNIEAKKRWFENLMALKKLNINHPQYQAYITSRRKIYQDIMADPTRKALYREKAKERQNKYLDQFKDGSALKARRETILKLLKRETSVERTHQLEQELLTIEQQLQNHKKFLRRQDKEKNVATKIRTVKESGNLEGLLTHLQQRIATQKIVVKQTITDKLLANKDAMFSQQLDAVEKAKIANDTAALTVATKELAKAMNAYAEQQNEVKVYVDHSLRFKSFRDQIKELNKLGWLDAGVPQEAKPALQSLIDTGNELCSTYKDVKFFKTLVESTYHIVNYLKGKL
jgi:hypothetical protein